MAEKTLEIGIIGLGKFGLRMATTLASMGHTVIGIDMSDARVQLAEELLDTVYKADATSLSVLRSLHVQDLDWVVISVGEGVEQSLSITLNVQELGGPTARFDGVTAPHTHLRCKRCGQVLDLESLPYDPALDRMAAAGGAVIESHSLVFTGLCPECAGKAPE